MYVTFPDSLHKRLQILLDLSLFVCAVAGFGCLIADIGWDLTFSQRLRALEITQAILLVFVAQETLRPLLAESWRDYLRSRWFELLLAFVFAAELLAAYRAGDRIFYKLEEWFPGVYPLRLFLMVIAGLGAVGGFLYFLRSARTNRWLSLRKVSPGWMLIGAFVTLSLAGTGLLMMPNCQRVPVGWLDCCFTATSAACITGLVSVNTAASWTPTGQAIILILIQLGGLGVMTFTYFIAYFLSGGFSLSDRVVLRDLLNEDNIGFIGQMILLICGATFLIEAAGAVWLYFAFAEAGFAENGAAFSAFHAVSAFCNAGFTLFPADMPTMGIDTHLSIQSCVMTMIILGGLGFPALKNMGETAWNYVVRIVFRREAPHRHLNTHTRVCLLMTALLLGVGTVAFALADIYYGGGEGASAWRVGLFNSVTCRTAGFCIDNIGAWAPPAALFGIFLMFIGGCPGGTAGGVKATTAAVAGLSAWQVLRGKARIDIYNRSFGADLAQKAFAIITLSAVFVGAITLCLIILHPEIPPLNLFFEAVSAFSTTGASRGATPLLGPAGKALIIAAMLVGRVGILVWALALVPRARPGKVLLPKGTILLS